MRRSRTPCPNSLAVSTYYSVSWSLATLKNTQVNLTCECIQRLVLSSWTWYERKWVFPTFSHTGTRKLLHCYQQIKTSALISFVNLFTLFQGISPNLRGICCWKGRLRKQRKYCEILPPLTRSIPMNRSLTQVLMERYNRWVTSEICFEPRKCYTGHLFPGMPGKCHRKLIYLGMSCKNHRKLVSWYAL